MQIHTRILCITVMFVVIGILTGCGSNPAQDNSSKVGFVDMQTAAKDHPKYAALQQAQKEYDTLAAEVESEKGQSAQPADTNLPTALNQASEAARQEYNAKMTARGNEIRAKLNAAEEQARRDMQAQLDAYTQELDKEYKPKIFNLQLKLDIQHSDSDRAAVQAELDNILKERAGKIAAKQQELDRKVNEIMAANAADANKKMEAYGQELYASLQNRLAAEKTELAAQSATLQKPAEGVRTDKQQKLALKQQEVKVLQEFIDNDIKDKVAKVAVSKGLDVVFAVTKININVVDITNEVISEFKK